MKRFPLPQTQIPLQKEPLEVFFQKRCSYQFRKIQRKAPVPESFIKIKLEASASEKRGPGTGVFM